MVSGALIVAYMNGVLLMGRICTVMTCLPIVVIASFVSANDGWALDGKTFPGKGSREVWNKACKLVNEGHRIAKTSEEAAIPKFQEAIAIYPFADSFYLDLGVSYEKKKQPDLKKAEAAYRKATDLDPKDWQNWNALANVVGDQKRFKECRDLLAKAVACQPPAKELATINTEIQNLDNYLRSLK